MQIKKGSIVWYYDKKLSEWKRGKVYCVNMYGIDVKPSHGDKVHLRYDEQAIPASENKPNCTPRQLWERPTISRWSRVPKKDRFKYRILQEMGLA